MVVGMILLQTAIVAPVLFKTLEIGDFGRSIRKLWPKFFASLAIVGLLGTMVLWIEGVSGINLYAITILTFVLSSVCYLIIPATNKATDEGNQKRFDFLHRMSVSFTVVMLISNLIFFFL
tara:strand:+ start:1296 stop:1655 length:360 start_codon:yes stop_codon:yes gene_type:complete